MPRNILISLFFTLLSVEAVFAAPPIPARIGGTITDDGVLLTQATGNGYSVEIKTNGQPFSPVAEDTDGLNSSAWYLVDIPIFDTTAQPGGGMSGDNAVISVSKAGQACTISSPVGGLITIGASSSTIQQDLVVTCPTTTTGGGGGGGGGGGSGGLSGGGLIQFEKTTYSYSEDSGEITLNVVRTGGVGSATVTYKVNSGTATEGEDFNDFSGSLSWSDNSTVKVTLTIIDDNTVEGDETVILSLINPTSSSGTVNLGAAANTTLTIVENDTSTTNSGTITDTTLSGHIQNNGTLDKVTLGAGTEVNGGRITGSLHASGNGAIIRNAIIDAETISNTIIGPGTLISPHDNSGSEQSIVERLKMNVKSLFGSDNGVGSQAASGEINLNISALGQGTFSLLPVAMNVSSKGDGFSTSRDGAVVSVLDGIAVTYSPAAYNRDLFDSTLKSLGVDGSIDSHGCLVAALTTGQLVSLRFDMVSTPKSSNKSGQVSFKTTGSPNDRANFAYIAIYPDGAEQRLPATVHDITKFAASLSKHGIGYNLSLSTGEIAITGSGGGTLFRFMPDYWLTAGTPGLTDASFEAAGDLNGDGLADYYMITSAGKQAFYSEAD